MRKLFLKGVLLLSAAIVFNSCEKNNTSLDGAGNTYIKILHGGTDPIVIPLDVNPPQEEVEIFEVRRDASNSGGLNTPATITMTNTQVYLDSFNSQNGGAYELLPADAYTITASSGVTVSGDTWTVNLAAGEFSRVVSVSLDKTKMDLSKQYGFGIEIASTSVGKIASDDGEALVNVLIKNAYDAAYVVSGSMTDAANASLTGDLPMNYHLITTGEKTVVGWSPKYGDFYVDILNAGAGSVYGSFCPIFTFDPATNAVTAVTNYYGQPAGNGRYAQIDPSGINKYDPATGSIDVKFFMFQPSVIPLPNPRVSFDWHMENAGAR